MFDCPKKFHTEAYCEPDYKKLSCLLCNMMQLGSILQIDTLKIYKDTHRRVLMNFEIYKFAQDNILTPIGLIPTYNTRSVICKTFYLGTV